jgi:hypothetical protein
MKMRAMLLTAGLAASVPMVTGAQTAADLNSQVTTMNSLTSSQGQTNVTNKISKDFSSFLGSDANSVVTGLRNGTPISLISTTTTPSPIPGGVPVTNTTTTVITPPTGHMGFGNVYISLALAKQQLSTLGITQPTAQQLQAALTGGAITQTTGTGATVTTTTTNLQGILTMRSQNMGWGQIAQKLGFKLGPVMASMKSANHSLAATAAASSKGNGHANGQASKSSESGIVSASGKSAGNSAQGVASGKGSGDGIVTASGKGNGNAYGLNRNSGIVTGSGNAAASNGGVVSAGASSNGMANAKGHSK